MIQLFNVYKSFGSKNPALIDVSLTVNKGDFVFITGSSGAGKTTLLKIIFCAEKPSSGHALVNGRNLNRINDRELALLRRRIGVVFQDFKLLPRRNVFENVALALEIVGFPLSLIRKKVHQTLRYLGLANKEGYYPPQLSGGEQQRVAIARAIINNPLILLADEPTGNLDPDLTMEIMALLKEIHIRGTTVIVATHSQELLKDTRRRIVTLSKGRIV
ncbi:MAG: cell division ATP-binding protein FtsE [Desulfobacterales bacterium]|nr:cell division ATP-binding protein FtsE [Desulfobacterales bacterium]